MEDMRTILLRGWPSLIDLIPGTHLRYPGSRVQVRTWYWCYARLDKARSVLQRFWTRLSTDQMLLALNGIAFANCVSIKPSSIRYREFVGLSRPNVPVILWKCRAFFSTIEACIITHETRGSSSKFRIWKNIFPPAALSTTA